MKFTARCNEHNCDLKLRFDGQVFVDRDLDNHLYVRLVSFYCPEAAVVYSAKRNRFQSCDGQWAVVPARAEWLKTHKEFVRQQLMEDAEATVALDGGTWSPEEPSNKVDEANSLEREAPQGR